MKGRGKMCLIGIITIVVLMNIPCFSQEPHRTHGDLVGHIYEKDGVTPVGQAVVQIERLPDGKVYTSILSDHEGLFNMQRIEKGLYLIGVRTPLGHFNGQKLLGILFSTDESAQVEIVIASEAEYSDASSFVPLFPDPVGRASIVAGNGCIFDGIAKIDDKPREAGPFKLRSPE
jgi:hypothetical protein